MSNLCTYGPTCRNKETCGKIHSLDKECCKADCDGRRCVFKHSTQLRAKTDSPKSPKEESRPSPKKQFIPEKTVNLGDRDKITSLYEKNSKLMERNRELEDEVAELTEQLELTKEKLSDTKSKLKKTEQKYADCQEALAEFAPKKKSSKGK